MRTTGTTVNELHYVPWLRLDADDPEFCRGYEIGRLHARLESIDTRFKELMRRTNTEMLRQLVAATGREYTTEIVDDTWMLVTVVPSAGREGAGTARRST